MSANSYSNIFSLYIESLGIQPGGKESCLVDHCPANTFIRVCALSMGIQLIVDALVYLDSINTPMMFSCYLVAWFPY
jgi:hypothetical protein